MNSKNGKELNIISCVVFVFSDRPLAEPPCFRSLLTTAYVSNCFHKVMAYDCLRSRRMVNINMDLIRNQYTKRINGARQSHPSNKGHNNRDLNRLASSKYKRHELHRRQIPQSILSLRLNPLVRNLLLTQQISLLPLTVTTLPQRNPPHPAQSWLILKLRGVAVSSLSSPISELVQKTIPVQDWHLVTIPVFFHQLTNRSKPFMAESKFSEPDHTTHTHARTRPPPHTHTHTHARTRPHTCTGTHKYAAPIHPPLSTL